MRVEQEMILTLINRIRHRGPDWSGCVIANNHIFSHERLAIVGLSKFLFLKNNINLYLFIKVLVLNPSSAKTAT